MERLPYIDEHSADVPAGAPRTWEALRSVLRGELGATPPPGFVSAMRLEPPDCRGNWAALIEIGSTLPGFEVRELRAHEHLALVGRHRFSRYALVFDLDEVEGGTRVRAQTRAAFPGLLSRVYRALVIGSRMHHLVVRRLLRRVAERV